MNRPASARLRAVKEYAFQSLCLALLFLTLLALSALLYDVFSDGLPRLSFDFVTGYPSRFAERAGILPALVGSVFLIGLTLLLALPIGVGAAVYLEEYQGSSRFRRLGKVIEVNISNLASVPSIIYGILGLAIFVRTFSLGRSLLAGALTLALLILPVIIISSREALRTVPRSVREASLALGATQWQTVRHHVLPSAFPGILTGTILALSRAIGETAPLVTLGALTYVAFLPENIFSPFTVLPIQIFNWVSRPQPGFHANAAAAICVLLPLLLLMNGVAIWLRYRLQRRQR